MKCPKCQTENPETRKFCRQCGAKLSLPCPQCGCENVPGDRFCGECGHDLAVAQNENYFNVLGMYPTSDKLKIEKHYNAIDKKDHAAKSAEIFKLVNEAYEVLVNPEKRAQYDAGTFTGQLKGKDLYKNLGISKDASQEEIKQAYRMLAYRHHPDHQPGKVDAAFKALQTMSEADLIIYVKNSPKPEVSQPDIQSMSPADRIVAQVADWSDASLTRMASQPVYFSDKMMREITRARRKAAQVKTPKLDDPGATQPKDSK